MEVDFPLLPGWDVAGADESMGFDMDPSARPTSTTHASLRSLVAELVAYGPGLAHRVRELAPVGVDAALDFADSDAVDIPPFGPRARAGPEPPRVRTWTCTH